MEFIETSRAFRAALDRLKEVLAEPENDVTRDAAIKRFEFTFELCWKAIQRFLREEGIPCNSPKGCLREAFSFGLIEDDPLWMRMIDDRNLTVYTYNEKTARKIYENLKDYVPLFELVSSRLSQSVG